MRIQLKQHEIEAALKGYISNQGIAVSNKAINMDFTSGRKNNGLSVEIIIEDFGMSPEPAPTEYEHRVLEGTAKPVEAAPVQEAVESSPTPASSSLFG